MCPRGRTHGRGRKVASLRWAAAPLQHRGQQRDNPGCPGKMYLRLVAAKLACVSSLRFTEWLLQPSSAESRCQVMAARRVNKIPATHTRYILLHRCWLVSDFTTWLVNFVKLIFHHWVNWDRSYRSTQRSDSYITLHLSVSDLWGQLPSHFSSPCSTATSASVVYYMTCMSTPEAFMDLTQTLKYELMSFKFRKLLFRF